MSSFRIAHVLESAATGVGRNVLDLAQGMSQQGHDIIIIWSPDRASPDFIDRILRLRNVSSYALPMQRAIGWHDIHSLNRLTRLLSDIGPFDILHGHSSKAGALVRLLPRKIPGARVYTPHAFRAMDPNLGRMRRAVFGTIEWVLSFACEKIIVTCRQEYELAQQLKIPSSKLHIILNGCDAPILPTRSQAREALRLLETDIVFGFVGRLDYQKAPERIVNALSDCPNNSIKLILIGDGEKERDLQRQVQSLGLSDRIIFAGAQNGQLAMPAFDYLVMPSRYESGPYVLLEAILAGIPIISTAVGNASDLILDGYNGRLVQNTDDPEVWGGVIASLSLPETLSTLQENARLGYKSVSLENMITNTIQLYEGALLAT